MVEIQKLNKTFQTDQILGSDEMNSITGKIDEVIDIINTSINNIESTLDIINGEVI